MDTKSKGSALWVATEEGVFVYLQGRYLPPLYFVGRALVYPLLNWEQAKRATSALAEWFALVEQLRTKHRELHGSLVRATAQQLGAVLLQSLQHRVVFAAGRSVRAFSASKEQNRRAPAGNAALASFVISLALQHAIGWPADYCRASIVAARSLVLQVATTAAGDRALLERVMGLASEVAELLRVTGPHQMRKGNS